MVVCFYSKYYILLGDDLVTSQSKWLRKPSRFKMGTQTIPRYIDHIPASLSLYQGETGEFSVDMPGDLPLMSSIIKLSMCSHLSAQRDLLYCLVHFHFHQSSQSQSIVCDSLSSLLSYTPYSPSCLLSYKSH